MWNALLFSWVQCYLEHREDTSTWDPISSLAFVIVLENSITHHGVCCLPVFVSGASTSYNIGFGLKPCRLLKHSLKACCLLPVTGLAAARTLGCRPHTSESPVESRPSLVGDFEDRVALDIYFSSCLVLPYYSTSASYWLVYLLPTLCITVDRFFK